MENSILKWFGLVSVVVIGLFGVAFYITCLVVILSFIIGVITVLYLNYDSKKIFTTDIDTLDDPLQQVSFSVQLPKLIEIFQSEPAKPKFDSRITGSETIDSILNEIITNIVNDHVKSWYEIISDDEELTEDAIKKLVLAALANVSNRVKSVDWIQLLSTKFPDELNSHLKLFKQSTVRLKHIHLVNSKEVSNGTGKPSPKKQDDKKTHKRNKSDTELSWPPDSTTYGKSKFYDSTENISGKTLKDLFFDLECSVENRQICRDLYCTDPEKEYALLCEVSEALLFLVAPEEAWKCHAMKLILIELLASVVLRPLVELLSDPDNINRAIIRTCCREISLPSELFLTVIRCSSDAEELDATLELVQKDIQKLHSKDSAGEWEIQDRQKLSSLHYLTRVIQARRATLGPDKELSCTDSEKESEEVARALKFLSVSTAWRSNAQYCLEIELNEADYLHSKKAVIDSLRSSALEICDMYLAPNRPPLLGLPENCHADLVRKITTDGSDFCNNPVACFDDVQKSIYDSLEEDPSWQSDYILETDQESSNDRLTNDSKKDEKDRKYTGDTLPVPGIARHNRSRSDIVGNLAHRMINESAGSSNLSTTAGSLSLSHSEISQNAKNFMSPLSACIIETALVQEKGKAFGIYAIAVRRESDGEEWHIYRRYSDFHDLHCSIKDKWPELSQLPFPAKKTFQNTSRSVLESRKRMLNAYLQSLKTLAQEARYTTLMSRPYLGGFLSVDAHAERQASSIDALLVNSLRAGMRTLKSMPDQFANTVDGVMDGISKVFQGKSGDNVHEDLKIASSDGQDEAEESAALRLLEEVLGLRALWLRRRLLAPIRTIIADRLTRKVLELTSSLTSPRNIVQYLMFFKQWLVTGAQTHSVRDVPTKARTRVAAKVGLLSSCSDELRHIAGAETARRGLLTVFHLVQTQEINKRLIYVLLEAILTNLFPDNNIQEMFRKLYSHSPRVLPSKKISTNV